MMMATSKKLQQKHEKPSNEIKPFAICIIKPKQRDASILFVQVNEDIHRQTRQFAKFQLINASKNRPMSN